MSYILSDHVKRRAGERGILLKVIDQIMSAPQQIVDETEPGQKVYQSIITFSENNRFIERLRRISIMKVRYDREVDILYIRLTDSSIEESDEDRPGMVIDYDAEGMIVGLEIMNASKRMVQPNLVELEIA